ncbi:CHAT domain-containing protein [Bizionia myxarmorum]|uniref:CHAT domain-containing protein n=1 Tax=Bizionia myxarmorum TaxID=291186 RepID=A0A5D0R4W3_9FLAO|nr:CHAT domain-containing tetratricopeptide repeat protein [Bizionia myxarmorum]TYB75901.1 CHAT domain-containing protein [Bizionia myxarmorum]
MKRFYFTIFFLYVFQFLLAQNPTDLQFKEAETFLNKGYIDGDYSGWKKADSIFNALTVKNNFSSVEKQILSNLYSIQIHLGKTPEKHVTILNDLIAKYHSNNLNNSELIDKLNYFKHQMQFQLKEPGAEDELLKIIKKQLNSSTPNNYILAAAYDFLGREYHNQKKFDKSADFCRKSSIYFRKTPFKHRYIASLQATGATYYYNDKIDSSLYFMKKAYVEIKKKRTPDNERISQLAFSIGIINQGKTGEYIEAEDFFKEAIDYEIKANSEDSPTLITHYAVLADNFYILKDIDQAEYYASKAYFLANDVLKTESIYLRSLAAMSLTKVYVSKNNFAKARELIDKVLVESVEFFGEDDKFTSQVFNDKAFVEMNANSYIEAEKYLLRSVKASENINRVYSKMAAYAMLNEMFSEINQFDRALLYAKKHKELINLHLKTDYKIKTINNTCLTRAYIGLKELDSAKMVLQEIKESLKTYDNKKELETQIIALENELLLEKYKKNLQNKTLDGAYQNIEPLIKKLIFGKSDYKYQNSKIFYSKSIMPYINTSLEICQLKYAKNQDPNVLNTIFKLMEINKSSILLDGITDFRIKIEKGVPQEIMDEEAITRANLMEINEKVYKHKKDSNALPKDIGLLIDNQLVLNSKLDSIQELLKNNFPEYYKVKNLTEAKSLKFYQKEVIKKGQCIIEYYLNDDKLYRLVISKDEVLFDELPKSKTIIAQIEQLYNAVQSRTDISKLSQQLGQVLLPEFSSEIKELIFITDGSLGKIPFEILDYKQAYLLQNYQVSYAGSLQLYQEQVAIHKKQETPLNWMGFAPDYKEKLLATNKQEVKTIAKLTNGTYSVGVNATKQSFLKTSNNASILHLATHATLNKENPMLNKMIFYDNGNNSYELTSAEIYGLSLRANLAVLSACETGRGTFENDGIMSMSRAFAYAGVPSTIMSLWKVPDTQTTMIMVLFYENLKKGQQKNEALQNAKLNYLESVRHPELKHPYYWAGFVLNGDITPIQNTSNLWWYLAASTIVLALVFLLFWRKKSI